MPAARPAHRRDRVRASHLGELVLVASDDIKLRRLLCEKLDTHGYRALIADSATRVEDLVFQTRPVVILLDIDGDHGLSTIASVRARFATPIVAIASKASEGDCVAALDAGADDHVVKPVGTKELLARIRVTRRRTRPADIVHAALEIGPISIDVARHRVTVSGQDVCLTPLEFRLVDLLARFRGQVVTREQLLQELWGDAADQDVHLRVQIAKVRKKIEQDPRRPRWLVTVAGIGYRFGDG